MSRDDPKWNSVIRTAASLISAALLMAACKPTRLLTDKLSTTEEPSTPAGYRQVTSSNGSFQYWIPADWTKTAMNNYKGPDGDALEQILPPAKITLDYCGSFVYYFENGEEITRYQYGIRYNGQIRGCYQLVDILETQLQKEWRQTSFDFATDNGVEELVITVERQRYNEAQVLTIIDSIRIK